MIPELERLRAAAKSLRKADGRGDPDAEARLARIHGDRRDLKHADYLHVIAVEAGHASWPKLKFALEAKAMSRDQRAERLKMALYFGQDWVVDRLLAEAPDLPGHNLGLQIAMYDAGAVRTALAADQAFATTRIGVRTPILHLAFSQYHRKRPDLAPAMLEIAEMLVKAGADPDDGYAAEPGSEHKLSALYGALGHAGNLVLAEWLLARGADPNDNESLYHATELGHLDGLRLLFRYNADPRGTNALNRALDFDNPQMVRLMLDGGADPNEAAMDHPSGEPVDTIPALHQAARRWCRAEIAALLLDHGADPTTVWQGATPFALACRYGNDAVARALEARGAATPLSPEDKILAACAGGRPPDARLDRDALDPECRRLATHVVARPERLDHLKALMLAGFDPEWTDVMDLTPLHVAGWEGLPDHVDHLLTLAPDLDRKNAFGGDALGTVIHGAEFCPNRASRDHIACARLLLDAGATLRRRDIAETGNEDMAAFLEDWSSTPG